MKISDFDPHILVEAAIPSISPQAAKDRGLFGPVYHGTTGDIEEIIKTGFHAKHSVPSGVGGLFSKRPTGTSNGYALEGYGFTGIAAPIHHLGFGNYFTTVKAIAKQYNGDTVRGLKTFYLDCPKRCEINFGSPNTMMRWWIQNGYDMTPEATKNGDFRAWVKATGNLTRNLRKQYDAVWFKGKSIRKLLDGDQICVYDASRIVMVDPKLATGLEIGSKVVHTQVIPSLYKKSNELYVDNLSSNDFGKIGALGDKWRGVFRSVDFDGKDIPRSGMILPDGRTIGNAPIHRIPPPGMVGTIVNIRVNGMTGENMYEVKWQKGGTMYNYRAEELKPVK